MLVVVVIVISIVMSFFLSLQGDCCLTIVKFNYAVL